MRVYRHVCLFIDHIDPKPVPRFHQDVQVLPIRVQLHPPGVVPLGCVDAPDKGEMSCLAVLLVRPDLVGPHVGGVEIGLAGVEDHTVNGRVGAVLVVLDVRLHATVLIDGEDIPVACVFVEGIAIDVVGWLLGR